MKTSSFWVGINFGFVVVGVVVAVGVVVELVAELKEWVLFSKAWPTRTTIVRYQTDVVVEQTCSGGSWIVVEECLV